MFHCWNSVIVHGSKQEVTKVVLLNCKNENMRGRVYAIIQLKTAKFKKTLLNQIRTDLSLLAIFSAYFYTIPEFRCSGPSCSKHSIVSLTCSLRVGSTLLYPRHLCRGVYSFLYPRHLCRGVYSFRLDVRPFVCSFVRSCVRSFVTFRHVRRIYIKVFG